jgi:hypothetical protein
MELMKRYGVYEFRDEISWSNVETARGEYQIPDYGNQFTAQANEMGMNPLLICDYSNRFYADGGFPNDEEAYQAFGRYCHYLAKQMRGRVDEFEIWNEWSVGCGMRGKPGSNAPEYYVPLLKEAYRQIKTVAPQITVVGLGGEHSANHFENIRVMFQEGAAEFMDAYSVHSYRYPRSPEKSGLFEEIMKVAELGRQYDAPERIWVTEIGWPTHLGSRGVPPRLQAKYAVRTLAILQSTGVVEKVHWYDFKDDGLERTYNENNFGVVRHQIFNYQPKPAAVAISFFSRMTAGAFCLGMKRTESQEICHYCVDYRLPSGKLLKVLWALSADGEPVAEMPLQQCLEQFSLQSEAIEAGYDIMGAKWTSSQEGRIGDSPVYLVLK